MSLIDHSLELRSTETPPQPPAPAGWKIALATTAVGPIVGLLCLAAIGATWLLISGHFDPKAIRNLIEPARYVLFFGLFASLVSGLLAAGISRKRRWLRMHQTVAIAAASCLTPLGAGLLAAPFTFGFSGLSLPFVGFYAGMIMLPVAITAAIISRPIILWLLDWKRPGTV